MAEASYSDNNDWLRLIVRDYGSGTSSSSRVAFKIYVLLHLDSA